MHPRTSCPHFSGVSALAVAGALVAGAPAHGVTFATVNDRSGSVTLAVGESATIRFDVARPGGTVQVTLARDVTGTGKFDPLAPVYTSLPVIDGGAGDKDPAPGRVAWLRDIVGDRPVGPYVLHLLDRSDGSTLDLPGITIVPKPEPQAIAGRVAVVSAVNPAGTPPADAVIWAYSDVQTPIASAHSRPDGSYLLPVPPGTYLVFAEWLGGLHSQRQVVSLSAGQQVSSVNLPLLHGQEVAGTVQQGGQRVADAVIQATGANGTTTTTRTFTDGSYVLVLPPGRYRISGPGASEEVTVGDTPVDGVDFPPAAPAPSPTPGTILTVAGHGIPGFGGDGRPAVTARFLNLQGLVVDREGNLCIADGFANRVRKVDGGTGIISTVAGGGPLDPIRGLLPPAAAGGFGGDGGPATAALLNSPQYLAVDGAGDLYFSCSLNHRVRRVDTRGVITTVAGSGPIGTGNGSFSGDGGPAATATLNTPRGVALDGAGNLFIADAGNHRVRKVSASGTITTVAGGGSEPVRDGATATNVALASPYGLAVDGTGNLYVGDVGLNQLLKISPAGSIRIVAGTGTAGFSGDGGPATAAQFSATLLHLAVDSAGNLFFADNLNGRIRRISPDGIITTVAGTGDYGFAGDGGPATAALLASPVGVAVDAAGNVLFTDQGNRRVRKVIGIAAPGLVGAR